MSAQQQQKELLAWAASKIEEAQREGVFGTVTIFLEGGKVVRSKTEKQDKPGGECPRGCLTPEQIAR